MFEKCLKKDPNDRYQDTRDLVVDLRSLRRQYDSGISDTTSTAIDVPRTTHVYGIKLGWKKLLVAALAALVVIIVAVALFDSGDEVSDPEDALANLENLGENITRALADKGLLKHDGSVNIPGLPSLPAQANALAILGFDNKTGNAELDWLQAGLPEILLTDLAQSGAMNIIGRNRVLDCLQDKVSGEGDVLSHQECVTAARSLGAATVLSGAFFKMGDKIRIDARLEDITSGQIILAEKVVGEDPFVLVDSLTHKIALSLDMFEVGSSDREVADITSSSPEAYKEYVLGMEPFRLAQYDSANVYFEKAIAIDSTFALPYMRIGMGFALRGRTQQAMHNFTLAQQYEDRLPVKERSLLDIYKDVWLNQQFDEGTIKAQSYVSLYPNDKEARSFYAILLYELKKDKEGALAQLDTVLAIDPRYHSALNWYSDILIQEEEYEKAIDYNLLMIRYHPGSVEPYQNLMNLYMQQNQHADAIATAHDALNKFPEDVSALTALTITFVNQRRFDSAAYYLEERLRRHGDDPYQVINYHRRRSNLEFWLGRFKEGMRQLHESAKQAKALGDSAQIWAAYSRIANRYEYLEMPESTLYYSAEAFKCASMFQGFDYYFNTVEHDPSSAEKLKPEFDKAVVDFRSRLPQELWGLADEIDKSFNALCVFDTAAMIEAHEVMLEKYAQNSSENREVLGRLLVLTGRYEEGKRYLNEVVQGRFLTDQARYYLRAHYYLGLAEEALGDTQAAVEAYREVLKYWDKADIQLSLITDARERLARLTS